MINKIIPYMALSKADKSNPRIAAKNRVSKMTREVSVEG